MKAKGKKKILKLKQNFQQKEYISNKFSQKNEKMQMATK